MRTRFTVCIVCFLFGQTLSEPEDIPKCGVKSLVFFVLDGSTAVGGEANFQSMKAAIRRVIKNLAIDPERGFNVGVTSYDWRTAQPGNWVDLRQGATATEIILFLDRMKRNSPQGAISVAYKGFYKAVSRFRAMQRGFDDTTTIVWMTNSPDDTPQTTLMRAARYKSQGTRFITVATGPSAPDDVLREIASGDHNYLNISYSDLPSDENVQRLTDLICDMPDLCPEGASLVNLDPRGCNSFTQCTPGKPATVRSCGTLFWDNTDLICKPLNQIRDTCLVDPCRDDGGYRGRFNHYPLPGEFTSCRASTRCFNRRMCSVECCPTQEVPIIGNLIRCSSSSSCTDSCAEVPFQRKEVCQRTAVSNDITQYMEQGEIKNCTQSQVYSEAVCACAELMTAASQPECKPDLVLNFDTEGSIVDSSAFPSQLNAINVTTENGTARFDGVSSCIRVPGLNNAVWGAQLRVDVVFREDPTDDRHARTDALISNSGCNVYSPSIQLHVAYNFRRARVGANLDTGISASVTADVTTADWKLLTLTYDGFQTSGAVTLNATETETTSSSGELRGNVKRSKCDLSIGCGFGLRHFKGLLRQVRIWRCIPTYV